MVSEVFDLSGKAVLVTGASSGFGEFFATSLAARGARVVVAARRRDRLETLAASIAAAGGWCHVVEMDVARRESVLSAVAEAWDCTGGLDVLVNNAGVGCNASVLDMTEEEWDTTVDINLKGAFLVAQQVARRCVEARRPASIINIASILGERVASHLSAYCASKGGLLQLTRAMALELARYGIRVNAIAPGYVETDINRDFFKTDAGGRMLSRIPTRRLGQVHELLGPLLLLASDAGSYMTGAVLAVDGGHLVSTL
jgi:NAD(P)-dependent dehydrogenase (short-subunit alcohol dehydrogenase family)